MIRAVINCAYIVAGFVWCNTFGYYLKNPGASLFAIIMGLSPVFCVYIATA